MTEQKTLAQLKVEILKYNINHQLTNNELTEYLNEYEEVVAREFIEFFRNQKLGKYNHNTIFEDLLKDFLKRSKSTLTL